MRRTKTLVGFALLVLAAMLASFSHRNQTLAADYSCKLSPACPGIAQCSGDRWMRTGDCSISCFKEIGAPGEVVFSGSANCGTGAGGRATGDLPGSN
jgi:hypothetical protein